MKYMIFSCVWTVVLVLKLETSAVPLSVQGPHHHPIYRYSCNEDLSVTFKGVNGTIEYFPPDKMKSECTIDPVLHHDGNFKISKKCLTSTDFKGERYMRVRVYDLNEGETLPTTTISPNNSTVNLTVTKPKLITGHHILNLTCLPLKEEGVDRIALAETGITDIEQMHNVYNEIGQVEMRFKEGENYDDPDLSEVYIGDRFYMYLKYMGNTKDYIIVPQTCTAYKGNFRKDNSPFMELWAQNSQSRTDCTTDEAKSYKVMTNFKRLNDTIVHAELHGFRFNTDGNSGFDDITISCNIKICTSIKGKCKDNCTIKQSRKKRETDEIVGNRQERSTGRIRSQTVSRTIKVGRTDFKSNKGGRNDVHIGTMAIVLAGMILNKVLH